MKKNMLYLATGAVFLVFAVCIAYVFTEPSPQTLQQSHALQEHDASQLALNEKPIPPANALVFTAKNNTADTTADNTGFVTEPPKKEIGLTEQAKQAEAAKQPEQAKQSEQIEPSKTNDKEAQSQKTKEKKLPADTQKEKNSAETAPGTDNDNTKEKAIQETAQQETAEQEPTPKKAPVQDVLPVPFDNDPLRTKVILESHKNANTIVYAELFMDGNQVSLVFEGNKPIKPKTFRLNNPERVVVDIEGYWILKLPKLISNRMVKEIRSNAQKDKTRIVFEAKVPLTSTLLYRIHSRKYQLVFK